MLYAHTSEHQRTPAPYPYRREQLLYTYEHLDAPVGVREADAVHERQELFAPCCLLCVCVCVCVCVSE